MFSTIVAIREAKYQATMASMTGGLLDVILVAL